MLKKLLLISIIVLICSPCFGANDFSGDANCKALWRLENGALTTDSKGTNTLTPAGTPTADAVTYKEGAASCDLDNLDSLYILDGNLDAGYPFKNGDSTKKFSYCAWFYMDSVPAVSKTGTIYFKFAAGKNVVQISTYRPIGDTLFYVWIGYNGGVTWEAKNHATAMVASRWYHVGYTYQDSDKSFRLRIWDDTAGALLGGAELTGNYTNNINIEDSPVGAVGNATSTFGLVGKIDEVVIFNDILTADEIDQIRSGTYGAAAPSGSQVIIIN